MHTALLRFAPFRPAQRLRVVTGLLLLRLFSPFRGGL
jgi:hypothetical protein